MGRSQPVRRGPPGLIALTGRHALSDEHTAWGHCELDPWRRRPVTRALRVYEGRPLSPALVLGVRASVPPTWRRCRATLRVFLPSGVRSTLGQTAPEGRAAPRAGQTRNT